MHTNSRAHVAFHILRAIFKGGSYGAGYTGASRKHKRCSTDFGGSSVSLKPLKVCLHFELLKEIRTPPKYWHNLIFYY
jgi:hypothetical protein